MPLEILAPMVLAGIALAVVLVKLLVNAPENLLESNQIVHSVFMRDFPLAETGSEFFVTFDKRIAAFMIAKPERHLGVVEVMGSKHLTRLLGSTDIRSVEREGAMAVSLRLRDFTLPAIGFKFDSGEKAEQLMQMLGGITKQGGGLSHE